MTGRSLAESYLRKAEARLLALDTLMGAQAFSDVVQEAQEIVELTLKAALRLVGVEPPKVHDVSALLREYADRLTGFPVETVAAVSTSLRKERELAFYGDVDFIPDEHYALTDAEKARDGARLVVAAVRQLVQRLDR